MTLFLFKIGFLPVRIWDVLDILIVGYLIYQIYRLLKGSIAFNILIGVLTLYVVWWLVNQLEMDLLSAVLDQFVLVGVTIIVIIFQPEVRRFLLFLGDSTLRQRSNFLGRIIDRNFEKTEENTGLVNATKAALLRMSRKKTGAIIVLSKNISLSAIKFWLWRKLFAQRYPRFTSLWSITQYSYAHDGKRHSGQ